MFRVGDKVIRKFDKYHSSGNFWVNMCSKKGYDLSDVYTVTESHSNTICLEGFGTINFEPENFELAWSKAPDLDLDRFM